MIAERLSEAQLKEYKEKGYLIEENYLSKDELAAVQDIVPEITSRLMVDPDESEHIFEKDENGNPVAVRCVHNLLEQHGIFRKFAAKPKLIEIVSSVMSQSMYFFRGIMVIKQRGVGSAFPWHQDYAYWGQGKPELVGVWIALREATIENGCMDIIPGSHKWGVLPVRNNDPGNPILSEEQENMAIPAPVPAGGAIFFHSLLVHKSNPNRSNEDRWAIVYEYSAPEFQNGLHRFDRSCGWNPVTGNKQELY